MSFCWTNRFRAHALGVILALGMLIAPPATIYLLSYSLATMFWVGGVLGSAGSCTGLILNREDFEIARSRSAVQRNISQNVSRTYHWQAFPKIEIYSSRTRDRSRYYSLGCSRNCLATGGGTGPAFRRLVPARSYTRNRKVRTVNANSGAETRISAVASIDYCSCPCIPGHCLQHGAGDGEETTTRGLAPFNANIRFNSKKRIRCSQTKNQTYIEAIPRLYQPARTGPCATAL